MRLRYPTAILAIAIVTVAFGPATPEAAAASLPQGVMAKPGLINRRLPDGRVFQVRQFGDEMYHWLETAEGYTVAFDQTSGNYEYLRVDVQGRFEQTGALVGRHDPAIVGIPKHARESAAVILAKRRLGQQIISRAAAGGAVKRAAYPNSGNIPILVILANFSDTTTSTLPSEFDLLFNGNPFTSPTVTSSVWHYYHEVSYGKVNIQATIVGWVDLPSTHGAYGAAAPFQADVNPRQMVRDAIDAVFRLGFDFSPFDINGDGILEPIIVIHSGEGEEASGNPDDIWSHQWNVRFPYPVDMTSTAPGTVGLFAYEYCTMPELDGMNITTLGVIVHELGHCFGLPDLYDYTYVSVGAGDWDLMASGSWNGILQPGDCPAHLSAWCKHYLKWLNLTTANGGIVTTKRIGARLPAIESQAVAYITCMGSDPTTSTEYLMLENRQWMGYDRALPNYGMLVWHVDDLIPNNDDLTHYHVALIQADGLKDLEAFANRGDLGDPFPGILAVRELEPYSDRHGGDLVVNTNSYYRRTPGAGLGEGDTNIWILNISNPLIPMTVDIRFLPNLFVETGSSLNLSPVRTPITFRDGSQRDVFAPGDLLRYMVRMGNRDDNYPFAILCEDTPPFWVELWGSMAGGLTLDYYVADSIRRTPGFAGNALGSATGNGPIYSLPDGSYSLAVTLDRLNEVDESFKVDNRWVAPRNKVLILRPSSGADLVVRDFSFGPMGARKGDALQLGGRVVNEGAGNSGPFWIEFWGSIDAPDKPYPALDFFLCQSIYVNNLLAGGSIALSGVSRTLSDVPPHNMAQTFSVGCFADRTDTVNETNETNNYQFVEPMYFSTLGSPAPIPGSRVPPEQSVVQSAPKSAVAVTPPPRDLSREQLETPELTVRASTVTLSGEMPPQDLQVSLTVHNWGLAVAGPNWAHVYVSRDAALSADDFLWLQGIRVPPLASGAEYTTAILAGMPAVPMGVYRLLGQCDVLNEVAETFEDNNVFDAGPFIVGPELELIPRVTTVTLSGQLPPQDLQVNVLVHNAGLTTASANWAHVYVSSDEFLSPDDYLWIQGILIPTLPAGAAYQTGIPVGAPPLPLGAYFMLVQCDVTNAVPEAIEDNNILNAGPLLVGPDLAFESTAFTELQPNVVSSLGVQFSESGTSVAVALHVVNRGILPAGPFWLEIWGSRTGGLLLDDFLFNSRFVAGLGPLGHWDLDDILSLNSVRDGPYTFTPVLDRTGNVVEVYENNNRAPVAEKRLVEIRAIRGINLRIPLFRFAPNPIRPGCQLKFNGSIVNEGDEHSGPFWVEFWGASSKGIPTPEFPLCESIYIPNLRPGQQIYLMPYQRTVHWNVPIGDCSIMLVLDRPDNISEYDETDNYFIVPTVKIMP